MIRTTGLVKRFRQKTAVNHIDIEVSKGEIVGLLGPNGAGKTTTFYMIIGLVKPNEGQIFLDNNEITRLPMHKRGLKGIGYLPQESSIFRKLTVEENIYILWEVLGTIKKADYASRLTELLDEMKITHLRKQKGYELSGGEKRRVEIVRALATQPSFILLDEPFAGIDPMAVHDIQDIIRHLKSMNIGVLITDHNVRETLSITDRAYIIHDGRVLTQGNSKTLSKDPLAREKYFGDAFKF